MAGKRLAPMLGVLVPLLRHDDVLVLTDAKAARVARIRAAMIRAAMIDRRLAGERSKVLSWVGLTPSREPY